MAIIPTRRRFPSGDELLSGPRRSVRFPEFPGNLVEHLSEARQLRYSSAASSQGAPLDITDCLNDLYAGATPVVRFKRASAEAA
jgi:hypothetical protein